MMSDLTIDEVVALCRKGIGIDGVSFHVEWAAGVRKRSAFIVRVKNGQRFEVVVHELERSEK